MSQVRKFKDGGSNTAETTSKSKHNSKYGHYIVDGTTYDVNDDFIRDYIASAKQFDDNSTNTVASHIVNALKSGQDVSLDTLNNRIYGINDYLNSEDIERSNEYSQNSLNKKYQRKYRRKEARPNSSLHQLNIGISNLGSINFTKPVENIVKQEESDKEVPTVETSSNSTQEKTTEPVSELNLRSYENSGFNDTTLEQAGYYIRQDSNGNPILYDENGQVVKDNIYLRGSQWADNTPWQNGAWYQGQFYTNDQLMNNNNAANQAIRPLFNAWRDAKTFADIQTALNSSGWKMNYQAPNINENNTFVSGENYLSGFTDLFNDGTYYWSDISDKYDLPEESRILAFYNPNVRDSDNLFKEQYAISHDDQSQVFDSIEKLQKYLNQNNIQQTQGYRSIIPLSQYKYIMNNGTRYFYMPKQYLIPEDESTAYNVYRDNLGNYYTDGDNGKMKLLQGKAILEKIKNGTVTAQELKNGFASEDNRSGFGDDGRFFGINVGTKNKNPYEVGAYDEYFQFYKKGGKIQKHQYGGLFNSGQVGKQKENKPVESKIGQPQKLKADKKLKTGADSANLAAGILDTAGLATSWIPGIGTAINILGSLSRLSADIQKDGFQWKDLGNFGINLGLDALTLLPGVGAMGKAVKTGVKAAKSVKRADKAAKVLNRIQPVLATAGAIGGTSQIAGAIKDIQNDEFTSESMGNLLSGIGNTAMGITGLGKIYRQAKVAKKLNTTPVKDKFNVNSEDKAVKKAAKKAGNWMNRAQTKISGPFKTLRYMYSPGKVESTIANNWQTLARSSNPYANRLAAEYLNKFGSQKIGNTLYSGERIGPNWMFNRYKLNRRQEYLALPPWYPPKTVQGNGFVMYQKKGGKIIKGQSGLKSGDLVYNNTSSPSYFDYNRSGIKFNGSNVDWTATYDPNSLYSKYRNIYLNNWDNPEFNVYKQAYLNQLSQGNNSIDVNNLSKDEFARITNDGLLGYAHNLYVDPNGDNGLYNLAMNQLPAATVTAKSNIKPIPQGKAVTQSAGLISNPALSNNQASEITNKSSNKPSGAGSQYTNANSILKNLKFNPDDLFGLIETTRSIIANNQLYKDLKEANTAVLKPYMPEIYDRYQDHITPIYQEAAKAKRNFVPTSTDSTVNYAIRQANEDAAQQLETEGRLKASEQYSQYLDKDLAARRAYAEDRRNTAFYNTQEMANKVMRDAQIDQARKLANNQSWSNFVMEMRNKISQDRQRKINFMQREDAIMSQRKYDEYINKKMAEGNYYNQFNALDADKKKQYLNAQDWLMQTNPDVYSNIVNGASVEALNYNRANWPKYLDYFRIDTTPLPIITPSSPVSMPAYATLKNGGKTPKYTQRHTGQKPDEAIWIQRNKDTAKALEKLHDAVIKLFMKALS